MADDDDTPSFRGRGAIHLGEDDGEAPGLSQSPAKPRTPTPWLTIGLYWLMIVASIVGFCALMRALSVIDSYDWGGGDAWPFFHQVFREKFSPVTGLLLMSVFWGPINLLSLRKQRETLPGILGIIYDIFMIIALIYFPAVCCSWLYDKWSTLACEYLRGPGIVCLPIYAKILRPEIAGLVCAYLVALIHLLLIVARVVTLIVDLHGKGRSRPLGRWLYQRGYSTVIAMYCISATLSIVGFCLMMWIYSSMLSLGGRTDYGHDIWGDHFHAGFGFLTTLLITVPVWLASNFLSLCASREALSAKVANIYDSCVGTGLIWTSLRAAKFLDRLEQSCGTSGHCRWIWEGLRPRHIAVITLGVIVGVIHLVLFLIRLSAYIRSTRAKQNVTVVVLHELDTSTWSEDRVAALSYALRGPESDIEAEAAVETEVEDEAEEEEPQPNLQEIFPILASVGELFKSAKSLLLGSKTASQGGEDEEDEFTALLSADNEDSMQVEEAEDDIHEGDVDLESAAGTANAGLVMESTEPPGPKSIDKPLPPPPAEEENHVET